MRLRLRISIGLMPQAAAALSISRSIAKVMTGRDTPRYGAMVQVWVVTARARQQ